MTARMPLLLAARLRLAPRWLASCARRYPGAVIAVTVAVAVIVVAGVVFAAAYGPRPACHLRAAAGAGRAHWTCVRGDAR